MYYGLCFEVLSRFPKIFSKNKRRTDRNFSGRIWEESRQVLRCDNPVVRLNYGEVNSVKKHNYKIWLNDGTW